MRVRGEVPTCPRGENVSTDSFQPHLDVIKWRHLRHCENAKIKKALVGGQR